MAGQIESIAVSARVVEPPREFAAKARISEMAIYRAKWERASRDPEAFWGEVARHFHWFKPFGKVMEWELPDAKWFLGGTTNLSFNCLDRHVFGDSSSADAPRRHKAAIIEELETGESRTVTYDQLLRMVCRLAGALLARGVKQGDRVGIYLPNTVEAAAAMLACARIGCPHTVIFGGFSAKSIADRLNDCKASALITADGLRRRGKLVPLKAVADEALTSVPSVHTVIVSRNIAEPCGHPSPRAEERAFPCPMQPARDLFWGDATRAQPDFFPAAELDAEHPLFLLYTSGTTGKPKGILHTTGGYMVWTAYTARHVFDLRDEDLYFCTADVGWITGHSYVVYGILANGATSFLYEGAPIHPTPDRLWQIIERHGITILYTAPTAIRTFMRLGDQHVDQHSMPSLRLLGSVGEPINPEAWEWYHEHVGKGRCPIVDTWWQTETGGIMISPLPGATPLKPGSCTLPLPGVDAAVVDDAGVPVAPGSGGRLVIRKPWPGMLRTLYGDHERFRSTYYADGKHYFAGDAAHVDKDGYIWVMGRMDDVVNVSGHRLGTAEIESALVSHESVAEAAVVARPDEITGSALVAFVTLKANVVAKDAAVKERLRRALGEHVAREIGKIAKPAEIHFAAALPKTRSGKIMRRLLRDIACGKQASGDTTTLEDPNVLAALSGGEE